MRTLLKAVLGLPFALVRGLWNRMRARRLKTADVARWRLQDDIPWMRMRTGWLDRHHPRLSLQELDHFLREARPTRYARRVIIEIHPLRMGLDKIAALRELLVRLRSSGVETVGLLMGGGVKEYFLATACERVVAYPVGGLSLTGISFELTFFKRLLDWLGIEPDFLARGKYKSAIEPLTHTAMSEASREAYTAIAGGLYNHLAQAVDASRQVPGGAQIALGTGPLWPAEAVAAKVIDGEATADALIREKLPGYGKDEKVKVPSFPALVRRVAGATPVRAVFSDKRIAFLPLRGPIAGSDADRDLEPNYIAAAPVERILHEVRRAANIHALVVHIDSGGGSAVDSDRIYRALADVNAQKPVIVHMGGVAASGGYYIACGGRAIIASPLTITGSIGVFGGKLVLARLAEKAGVTHDEVGAGAHRTMHSMFHPFAEDVRERLEHEFDAFYETFLGVVAGARKMSRDQAHAVAQGRIWTGADAKARGLVDELGPLSLAFARAKECLGIEPRSWVEVADYGPEQNLMQRLMARMRWHRPGLETYAQEAAVWVRLAQTLERERCAYYCPIGAIVA